MKRIGIRKAYGEG